MARDDLSTALEDGMTVAELIETLKGMDQEAKVVFAYNYGDHWRTQVAGVVQTADEGSVIWSEYHRMPKIEPDNDEPSDESATVVILNLE